MLLLVGLLPAGLRASEKAQPKPPQRFEAADSEEVEAIREGRAVYLNVAPDVQGPIHIPRLAAPLVSMRWHGLDGDAGLKLKPEQDTWAINWDKRPRQGAVLELAFDAEPLLPSEVKPITAVGDGSFFLPAHLATTEGENIRYEPQPFKNTVGYWTGKQDSATWQIKMDKPGRFNVAVLQGCGKGQGGSSAQVRFARAQVNGVDASIDFEVVETGHFQNFQWRTLGEVALEHKEVVYVTVTPQAIMKAALMDIRAIHLIRLPDKKK